MQVLNIKYHEPIAKKCDRCYEVVTEVGMKKHCRSCVDILRRDVKPRKLCIDCSTVTTSAEEGRCFKCNRKHKMKSKIVKKVRGTAHVASTVDPKWLSRGEIK